MTYTSEQKRRIADMVDAFEGCRKYLSNTVGICQALLIYCEFGRTSGVRDARDLIRRALYPHTWLYDYLKHNGHRYAVKHDPGFVLNARNLWLDKLISDCMEALK